MLYLPPQTCNALLCSSYSALQRLLSNVYACLNLKELSLILQIKWVESPNWMGKIPLIAWSTVAPSGSAIGQQRKVFVIGILLAFS
jgi:hypothetical protein